MKLKFSSKNRYSDEFSIDFEGSPTELKNSAQDIARVKHSFTQNTVPTPAQPALSNTRPVTALSDYESPKLAALMGTSKK